MRCFLLREVETLPIPGAKEWVTGPMGIKRHLPLGRGCRERLSGEMVLHRAHYKKIKKNKDRFKHLAERGLR